MNSKLKKILIAITGVVFVVWAYDRLTKKVGQVMVESLINDLGGSVTDEDVTRQWQEMEVPAQEQRKRGSNGRFVKGNA